MEQLRRVGVVAASGARYLGTAGSGGVRSRKTAGVMAALPRATVVPSTRPAHLSHIDQPAVVAPAVLKFLVAIDLWLSVP